VEDAVHGVNVDATSESSLPIDFLGNTVISACDCWTSLKASKSTFALGVTSLGFEGRCSKGKLKGIAGHGRKDRGVFGSMRAGRSLSASSFDGSARGLCDAFVGGDSTCDGCEGTATSLTPASIVIPSSASHLVGTLSPSSSGLSSILKS
jgi:hypothetical protein